VSRQSKAFLKGVKVSERHGAGEWTAERLSSVILIPLALWALWSGFSIAGTGYEGALDWFSNRVNAALLAATLLISIWHMNMGAKVIVDDYIHVPGSNRALSGLIGLICLLLAAASVFFIVRLALGSAPLPAGLAF
jgi:succinate dehydrogenase / fumarate reductase membrane anchor subunit